MATCWQIDPTSTAALLSTTGVSDNISEAGICWFNGRACQFCSIIQKDNQLVLNELIGRDCSSNINYWRDKQGHEIDFILSNRKTLPITIECKWSSTNFDPKNLKIFRRRYSKGKNYVVATDIDYEYERGFDGIAVSFVSLEMLIKALSKVG